MPEPPNSSRNLFWVSRLERPQITPPFLPPPPECIHFNSPGAADLISNVSTRRRWAQPGKRFGLRCCHSSGAGASRSGGSRLVQGSSNPGKGGPVPAAEVVVAQPGTCRFNPSRLPDSQGRRAMLEQSLAISIQKPDQVTPTGQTVN